MNYRAQKLAVLLSLGCLLQGTAVLCQDAPLGLFEGHGDVGAVGVPGSVTYDVGQQSYLVAGGGENMWFGEDALHFVWKRMSGDVSLAADIRWIGTGGNAHRKACLLIRQSLDPKSAYADAVVHGDGLTSNSIPANAGRHYARDSVQCCRATQDPHREAGRLCLHVDCG